jgi:hypothetical protein
MTAIIKCFDSLALLFWHLAIKDMCYLFKCIIILVNFGVIGHFKINVLKFASKKHGNPAHDKFVKLI